MGGNLAAISPISSYGPFITGLIATQLTALGLSNNPWSLFIKMIPYNLYGIFAMLTALFVIRTGLDIGPMYKAEKRALETGKVIGDDDKPMVKEDDEEIIPENNNITIKNFVIPMASLIVSIFTVIFWSGNIIENGVRGAFLNANIVLAISTGFLVGSIAAAIIAITSGLLNFEKAVDKWTEGIVKLMFVPIILVLAWSIGSVADAMNVQAYLVDFIEKFSLVSLVPALVFLVGSIVSFSTGSSWGVFAIMMPIALPMAHNLGVSLPLIIGAVIGSGLFGDHCSPISDTTIMSSTGAACDHIEHVRTQLPYALLVGIAAFIG